MDARALQRWLVGRGAVLAVDGVIGPKTQAELVRLFANPAAPAVTDVDIAGIALRLGCAPRQLRAVAAVESGGSAFDRHGRPKILFERHLFNRFTGGRFPRSAWCDPVPGGYNDGSWNDLVQAAAQDVDAAFASVSWGRFQVLGAHAGSPRYDRMLDLGFSSPADLAWSTVGSEAGHYELLARYVDAAGLRRPLQRLSTNPKDNEAFAAGYNGPGFKRFAYDQKLADALRAAR